MLKIFSFSILLLLWLCSTEFCYAHDYIVPYDNVPITAKTWKEIDITWPNPFNPKHTNIAKLLRPIHFIEEDQLVMGKPAQLNMVGIGIPNQGTIVTAIKPLSQHLLQQLHAGTQPVIGYFKHYVNDVRTYRFIDKQGHYSTLHATPNHPFYVKELQAFLPISQITSTMTLIGASRQGLHLVCRTAKSIHCGIPYRSGHVFVVYNIEVYRQHIYRVGQFHILVHNKNPIDTKKNAYEIYQQLDRGEFIRVRQKVEDENIKAIFGHDFVLGKSYDNQYIRIEMTPIGRTVEERLRIIPARIMSDTSEINIDSINRFMSLEKIKLINRRMLEPDILNSIIERGVSTAPRSVHTLTGVNSRITKVYPGFQYKFALTGNNCRIFCKQITSTSQELSYRNNYLFPRN